MRLVKRPKEMFRLRKKIKLSSFQDDEDKIYRIIMCSKS